MTSVEYPCGFSADARVPASLELPRAPSFAARALPGMAHAPAAPGEASAPLPARLVLVVDDNVDAAETLASLLRAWGHSVAVANDGPAALAILQTLSPDLALLDIGMPTMDGYELAAHLRFQVGCENMPVIAITGLSGHDAVRRSKQMGFAGHLVKPVDPASLASLLG